MVKNKTLLEQSAEIQEILQNLENCPTCLQEVSAEHKHKILTQEQNKILKAQALLRELEQKKKEIASQKESLERQILDIIAKENLLAKITAELQQLRKKEEWGMEKKEQLRQLAQENNSLVQQQQNWAYVQKIEESFRIITEKQRLLQGILHQELLHKNLQELTQQEQQYSLRKTQLQKKKEELQNFLGQKKDVTAIIAAQKKILSELIEQEKEAAVKIAQLQTQAESIKRHLLEIQERIDLLNKEKEKLAGMQELYYWLEEHFLSLTYTIEKQVMMNSI